LDHGGITGRGEGRLSRVDTESRKAGRQHGKMFVGEM
jgi:hypothetical protein